MGLGPAGFADTTTTSTTDATTTATTAAPCANSATLMKHGPAGLTPSFVPYGSIQDALSIRIQWMDEARVEPDTCRLYYYHCYYYDYYYYYYYYYY